MAEKFRGRQSVISMMTARLIDTGGNGHFQRTAGLDGNSLKFETSIGANTPVLPLGPGGDVKQHWHYLMPSKSTVDSPVRHRVGGKTHPKVVAVGNTTCSTQSLILVNKLENDHSGHGLHNQKWDGTQSPQVCITD